MAFDWSAAGTTAGGIVTAIFTYYQGRRKGRQSSTAPISAKMFRRLESDLHECNKSRVELKDKLSALETELVVIRKLLPGGEWYTKLKMGDE